MASIWDSTFIVVDVETSGSDPVRNRMTEIACVEIQGGEIKRKYSSLINPHQYIPHFIVNMTGITNEMAHRAPESSDVMAEVEPFFTNPNVIFVAHNVKFDFSFVQQTFLREGIRTFNPPMLCTLKLARKMLPREVKKNVGSLAGYFGVKVKNRHRALGDAEATAYILLELLDRIENDLEISEVEDLLKYQNKASNFSRVPKTILTKVEKPLAELPDSPGVYHFINKQGEIIYVGKAKSLRERVRSYFYGTEFSTGKTAEMLREIHRLEWQKADSELEALLIESREIKAFKPKFNVIGKKYRSYPFIKITNEKFPKIMKSYSIDEDGAEYFGPFSSRFVVDEVLEMISKKFKIRKCTDDIETDPNFSPCIYHQIDRCYAPCAYPLDRGEYKRELDKVRYFLSSFGGGIVSQLESKMMDLAENLEFERAAMLRDRLGELKKVFLKPNGNNNSVAENNLVLTLPNSKREKLLDVFIIKGGKLEFNSTYGQKAPLDELNEYIRDIFGNGKSSNGYTKEDIDELRIVSSWLYRQKHTGIFIYADGKAPDEIFYETERKIRNYDFDEAEKNVDYSENGRY